MQKQLVSTKENAKRERDSSVEYRNPPRQVYTAEANKYIHVVVSTVYIHINNTDILFVRTIRVCVVYVAIASFGLYFLNIFRYHEFTTTKNASF